ncbi:MAG: hypothetical protein WCV55_01175 [Candidatus Paceibacterota bacterium]
MKKGNSKKKITIDDLALITQNGFVETNGRIDDFRKEVNERFHIVDKRFDAIENKMIAQHTIEIEHLRDKVIQLEVRFAKFSK